MHTTQSADGTTIAFDAVGAGPTIILVTGALGSRAFDPLLAPLAEQLSTQFTAVTYDRRGRGDSGDRAPYAVEREIEDIAALIEQVGERAALYGISSGAVLALDAANHLEHVTQLALYEPPFIIDGSRPPLPEDYVAHLDDLIADGRRGAAVAYFMTTAIGIPGEYLEPMQADPSWKEMEAIAHTLPYDGRVVDGTMSGDPLPQDRWTALTAPTLVVTGGDSDPFFHDGAKALVDLLPDARHDVLEGQDHAVAPEAIAPVLGRFLSGAQR